MVLKYILRNFTRRKVRTILMILSLIVSTALVATMSATVETIRRSNVDLIASAVGRYDLSVSKRDTSFDPFVQISGTVAQLRAADANIRDVYPRMESQVDVSVHGSSGTVTLVALDQAVDDIGYVELIEGDYQLGGGQVAVLEETAQTYGLQPGDSIDVAYSFPLPRELGKPSAVGVSQRRASRRFTVAAVIRQDGVLGGGSRDGIIADLGDIQQWLNLPDRASTLIATVDPAIYETANAETAALGVRDVVRNVKARLGDDYQYGMSKASALDGAAQGFLMAQALINTYGLISLGVVGLLVHTMVMTNVQEQRRDMAVLRILGGRRKFLFQLVIWEVLVIGVIGVSIGIGLGQILTRYVVVPIIKNQMLEVGITTHLVPQLTLSGSLPVIASAAVVLLLSSLKPAQDAARTKVVHAINPGVADNIQLEDLAQLRERRANFKMFLTGLALMFVFSLIAGFQAIGTFGGPALEVMFVLLAFGLLVLGLGLMFFITTIPFEHLVLLVMGSLMPRLTYFAKRNVRRGETRNTLISLLVLFSGVLPSFLATQAALEDANFADAYRKDVGADAALMVGGFWQPINEGPVNGLSPSFRRQELSAIDGIKESAALTFGYPAGVSDSVSFRSSKITVYGVDGSLSDVLFTDLMEFAQGDRSAIDEIMVDPKAIIISEGLAQLLVVSRGDIVRVQGEGQDHILEARVAAIARSMPGIGNMGRSRVASQAGSDVLVSLASFRELTTPLDQPLPDADRAILGRVFLKLEEGADDQQVADEIGRRYGREYHLWSRFLEIEVEDYQRNIASQRIFLLVLTVISFTTAVFGVFAVIYVTIYARRLEIGMLKAVGMKKRELTGMLMVEAITMTTGAALAGIAAGASMGYVTYVGENLIAQQPVTLAYDTTVIPFIVIMVVLASMLGAVFSARRIVRKRAVEILRM